MKLRKLISLLFAICVIAAIMFAADTATQPIPKKPYNIINEARGVHIYWDAVDGYSKYGVWRSETGASNDYTWLGNPSATNYVDTKVESGKTYYYKITTLDTDAETHSIKSRAVSICYIAAPNISARINRSSGISLSWTESEGATGYMIYRTSSANEDIWTQVATISSSDTLTWTDTDVADLDGEIYKYSLCAVADSDGAHLSSGQGTGRTMVRLTTRELSDASAVDLSSVRCAWTASSAADGYEVRFMVGDTVYETFTVSGGTIDEQIFTDLEADQTYKIQIRSYAEIDEVGVFYSAWSEAKYVTL